MVGQPGSYREPLPRSPSARVLPPSNEPGLWSADRPRAAREYVLPAVLGFNPPAVHEKEAAAAGPADLCAQWVGDTVRFPSVAKALDRFSREEVACTGARAYFSCMVSAWQEAQRRKDAEGKELAKALLLYQHRAMGDVRWACRGMDLQRRDLSALFNTVETAWQNSKRTWLSR